MRRVTRILDVASSAAGLGILAPVLVGVAAAIKLDDGGPVLFVQERIGRGGKPFGILKFRTMSVRNESGALLTVGGDARITRVGRWLRRFKVDELPQLVNVLKGEMSLVGPRPEVAYYVAKYTAEQRRILDFIPGITDPASLRYRDESRILAESEDPEKRYIDEILPDKLRLSLEYAESSTTISYLKVILDTLIGLRRDGSR